MIKTVYELIFQVSGISEDIMSKGTQGQGDIHKGGREGGREVIKYYIIFIVWWSFERTLLRNTEFYLIITFLEIDITSRSESQHFMDL